jgi:hypothetical protein
MLTSRAIFSAGGRILESGNWICWSHAPRCIIRMLNVSPRRASSPAIGLASGSPVLRQLFHRAVNGQRGFRIWFFRLPFDGPNHSLPPHACYNEFFAPTATKC